MNFDLSNNHTSRDMNKPSISVVICTRNRGSSLLQTIESIFCNDHPNFELLVVDQSTNDETKDAVQAFLPDPRFRYIRTPTKGTGLSRNIGLNQARAEIVVYTDDDCVVTSKWLSGLERAMNNHPQVGALFCSVDPGPFNSQKGTIPFYHYKQDRLYTSFMSYYKSIGMGAGMVVRKSAAAEWGGFDDHLGPGSYFRCGEDHDIALRALSHHWNVFELSQETVIHNGFRTFEEYRVVMARDMYGLGAVHAKFAKKLDVRSIPIILYSILYRCLWQPLTASIKSKKPLGFRRFIYYAQGFFKGLQTPIDSAKIVYRLPN